MKRYFAVALLSAIVLALMVWPIAARVTGPFMGFAQSPAKAADGFDRLKILVGDWEATGEDGKPFTSNIRLVSNDTVLQETFEKKNHDVFGRRQPGRADPLLFDGQSAADGNAGSQRGQRRICIFLHRRQ